MENEEFLEGYRSTREMQESKRQEAGQGSNAAVSHPLTGEPDRFPRHLGRGRGSNRGDPHGRGAAGSHPHQPSSG